MPSSGESDHPASSKQEEILAALRAQREKQPERRPLTPEERAEAEAAAARSRRFWEALSWSRRFDGARSFCEASGWGRKLGFAQWMSSLQPRPGVWKAIGWMSEINKPARILSASASVGPRKAAAGPGEALGAWFGGRGVDLAPRVWPLDLSCPVLLEVAPRGPIEVIVVEDRRPDAGGERGHESTQDDFAAGKLPAVGQRSPTQKLPRHRPPTPIAKGTVKRVKWQLAQRKAELARNVPKGEREYTQEQIAGRLKLSRARIHQAEALEGVGWDLLRSHPKFSAEDGFVRWPSPREAAQIVASECAEN